MKKALCVIMATISIFVLAFNFQVFAEDGAEISETFYYGDKEITVTSTDNFSSEELKLIADQIAYGKFTSSNITQVFLRSTPLLCQLFGHSIKTATAIEVTHNAYTTSPKCLQKTYRVETCERSGCDYYVKTLISSKRISTCHG